MFSFPKRFIVQLSRQLPSYYLVLIGVISVILPASLNSEITSTSSPEMASNNQEVEVLKANSIFTNTLYQELTKNDGNLIFSPISVHAVLSMAYQGADGETKDAFTSTLNVTDTKATADGYNQIMSRLNNVEKVTLHLANKVYLKDGFSLQSNFKDVIVKSFLSEVEPIDFGKSSEAASTINKWVSDKTNAKITELITDGDVNSDTRLVLLNAIYFKGNWADKFNPDMTKEEDFYINNDDTVKVNMMHIKKKYHYKEDAELNAKILEMPYENNNVSMVIILPNERDGLAALEKKLSNVDLSTITNGTMKVEVEVSLPRFKVESTIDLKETLSAVGLENLFSPKCNLSQMIDGNEPLVVSKVIQKAFIEVNEEGAEAAAVTGMMMVACCLVIDPNPTRIFTIDHPFMYILLINNTVLFAGHVTEPKM